LHSLWNEAIVAQEKKRITEFLIVENEVFLRFWRGREQTAPATRPRCGDGIDEQARAVEARRLQAAPQRMVWGTDWPHVGAFVNAEKKLPDDALIQDLPYGWMEHDHIRRMIFVDDLYGFETPVCGRRE
jgi:hypothetical protein